MTGCAACGTRAIGHGRAPTKVRDLPVAARPAVLVWHKRRWRYPDPDCDMTTWSETCSEIAPRASLTARARARLAEMVNVGGDSIAAAAAAFGVGWHTAHQAVIEHSHPAVDDPDRLEGVTAIGVDEKRFLNATPEHRTVFTTQIVHLDRHRLLDVIEGRSRDVLDDWLAARNDAWCDRIVLATLDPAAGYRRALLDHLDHATLVVDHFHASKLANTAIDDAHCPHPTTPRPQTTAHRVEPVWKRPAGGMATMVSVGRHRAGLAEFGLVLVRRPFRSLGDDAESSSTDGVSLESSLLTTTR